MTIIPAAAPSVDRYWRSPAVILATLAGLAFLILGARAILIPTVASASFGLLATASVEAAWVQVYGSRTILLGLVGLVLVATRNLLPLALLFTFGALTPFFDMAVLSGQGVLEAFAARHATFVVVLGIIAALLWRQVFRTRGA